MSSPRCLLSILWNPFSRLPTILLAFVLTVPPHGAQGKSVFKCSSGISNDVCLPDDYSKFKLPYSEGVNKINVDSHIDEVLEINDKDCSITFASYFNVEWKEARLTVSDSVRNSSVATNVPQNLELIKDLWLPNVFIYNLKAFKGVDVLSHLAGLWMDKEKKLLYSQAAHITFICPMRFNKFPFDSQRCKFQVGSYSYDNSQMSFSSKAVGYLSKRGNSIALDYDITINQLNLEDQVFLGGELGNFSLTGFEMVLSRHVSTYIITYFLPSGLLVIISWISFLIPIDVIFGRMALLVMSFLVLVNICNTATTNTPKADGLTAIEAWMLTCILFVFGAFTEYATLLFMNQDYVVCKENKNEVQEGSSVTTQKFTVEHSRIDKIFLISFPILFFIFNIIYWPAFSQ